MAKVLIVEDEPDLCIALESLLTNEGFQVETAYDGVECLEAATRFNPDLILLSMSMPHMDGIETCRRLRCDPRTESRRILMTSGGTTQSHVKAAHAMGALGVLRYPCPAQKFIGAVRYVLAATA